MKSTDRLSAGQCRVRARECFDLALGEANLGKREAYLRMGEEWVKLACLRHGE